jgi:hypothetical protein
LWYNEALTLDEKYVLLGAFHDVVCTGEEKLGPEIEPHNDPIIEPEMESDCDAFSLEVDMNAVRWAALCDAVKGWLRAVPGMNCREYDPLAPEDPNTDYSRHAQGWLADIQQDLQAAALPGAEMAGCPATTRTYGEGDPCPQVAAGAESRTRRASEPESPSHLPGPDPYPVTVENHEQVADSIANSIAAILIPRAAETKNPNASTIQAPDTPIEDVALPLLDETHWKVLDTLYKSAHQTMLRVDIEAATDISTRAVTPILKKLLSLGLIHWPYGERKGAALTASGKQVVEAKPKPTTSS